MTKASADIRYRYIVIQGNRCDCVPKRMRRQKIEAVFFTKFAKMLCGSIGMHMRGIPPHEYIPFFAWNSLVFWQMPQHFHDFRINIDGTILAIFGGRVVYTLPGGVFQAI